MKPVSFDEPDFGSHRLRRARPVGPATSAGAGMRPADLLARACACVTLGAAVFAPARAAAQARSVGKPKPAALASDAVGRPDTLAYPIDPLAMPRPELRAVRTDRAPVIDGRLDDTAWARADSTDGTFIQTQPSPGYPSAERTVIRILYDDRALYVSAVLYDAHPDQLIVPGLEQDYDTHSSDIFAIALDTYHDRSNGFLFAVNPAGAIFDAQTFNDQRDVVRAWEGIVEARTTVNDKGWIVEMAIPFATLRFNPSRADQVWGLNFSRRIRRLNEDSNWAPVPRQFRLYKFSLAGTLVGLRNLPEGRNLWVKPYVMADRMGGLRNGGGSTSGHVGLDAKWGLTPRMTLDLTANTDFSQVEVDAEQVNLTRFSLFFPEKRDFFLENQGTFAFQDVSIRNYRTGSSPRNFKLFHSRRVGLSPERTPLPIGGGARLTGKIGDRIEVGFLEMQTRSTDGGMSRAATGSPAPVGAPPGALFPAENFGVARVKAHLTGDAELGAMFVNRQQTAGSAHDYNRAFGLDGNLTLLHNLILSAYVARTDERNPTGDSRTAAMFQAAWRDPLWDVSVLAKHVGEDFNPGMGFVDRRGVRRLFATVGAHPQPHLSHIVEVNPYVDLDVFTNLRGALETRSIKPGVSVLFGDGGTVSVEVSDRYERLFEPTRIAGAEVASGTYRWRETTARYVAAGSHRLSGVFSVSRGDFYDGRRTSLSATTRVRPNAHFSLDLAAQHNDLELGGTAFTADLFSARFRWARDVRTFFMAFVQYNQATDELITNARFNFIHAPLSDLFLVYTERRTFADGAVRTLLERGLTLKVTKLVSF